MSKRLPKSRIVEVVKTALELGINEKSAARLGISKGRISTIFRKQKFIVLMDHEVFDKDGKERSFKDLRKIYNQSLREMSQQIKLKRR